MPDLIFKKNTSSFLNNVYKNSINPSTQAVNYFPLHGSVTMLDRKYIFDTIQLAVTGTDANIGFTVLKNQMLEKPLFFLGYSFRDLLAWRAIQNLKDINSKVNMWVMLTPNEIKKTTFFTQLGFKTIIGNTADFLEFITTLPENGVSSNPSVKNNNILPQYSYNKVSDSTPTRRIEDFFEGFEPTWNQIISKDIKALAALSEIENKIYEGSHLIVTGMIFSGKTTLAMQLFNLLHSKNKIVYFLRNAPSIEEAQFIINAIKNNHLPEQPIIIIDDFCGSFEGVDQLFKAKMGKIVGFDRFYNYDSLNHKVQSYNVKYIEITELRGTDPSIIWDSIPQSIRNSKLKSEVLKNSNTLLEIIDRSLKTDEQIENRVKKMLHFLEKDVELLELLLLAAYFQIAKSYLSMNVLIAYFDTTNYHHIYDLIEKMKDQILEAYKEPIFFEAEQDYYKLRSTLYAYKILNQTNKEILKSVISKVADRVPNSYIYRYDIFKKYAYDSDLTKKIFLNVNEGLSFYEKVYQKDNNIYTYQHAAIYASSKGDYKSAFEYINRALMKK